MEGPLPSELQSLPTLNLLPPKTQMEVDKLPSPPSSNSSTNAPLLPRKKPKHSRRPRNPADGSQSKTGHGKRSSIYRGVTKHRWTGRYEAHLWDKNCWNPIQKKKGKQVYLGAYDDEDAAARTYDLAALKYWGPDTILNFPATTYMKEYEEMQCKSKEEYLASLRRRSSGFARGASKYRGVAKHHHNGRWEARIGRVYGNKYLYLGTFNTQEEAASAYDRAALEYRGPSAVTNFEISRYLKRPFNKQYPQVQQQQQQQQLFVQPMPVPTHHHQFIPQPPLQQLIDLPHLMPMPVTAPPVSGPTGDQVELPVELDLVSNSFDSYSTVSEVMGDQIPWTASMCIDSEYDSYSDINIDHSTDFFGDDNFADEISRLFDGPVSNFLGGDPLAADGDGGDNSGSGTNEITEAGFVAEQHNKTVEGQVGTNAASGQVNSASCPFPISICT